MLFLCPYCFSIAVPPPPDVHSPHALCKQCGKKPRAKISYTRGGEKLIKYVKDGRRAVEPMSLVSVRLYTRQVVRYKDANLSEVVRTALDREMAKDGER